MANVYMDASKAFANFQREIAAKSGEEATHAASFAKTPLLSMAVLAGLLAAAIGFWLTRCITRPLNEAVGVAQKVAAGEAAAAAESLEEQAQRSTENG